MLKFLENLVRDGMIPEGNVLHAESFSTMPPAARWLCSNCGLSETFVAKSIAEAFGTEFLDLGSCLPPHDEARNLLDTATVHEHTVIPHRIANGVVNFVTPYPESDLADKLAFILNRKVRLLVATNTATKQLIDQLYGPRNIGVDAMLTGYTDASLEFPGEQ